MNNSFRGRADEQGFPLKKHKRFATTYKLQTEWHNRKDINMNQVEHYTFMEYLD